MVRTYWWLRSYSSQALEGYKLKADCLFLIALELLFSRLYCNYWHKSYVKKIFNFVSDRVAQCLDGLWQKSRKQRREKKNENDKTVHQ